jgi:hypothetical protein
LCPKDGQKVTVALQDVGLILDPCGPVRLVDPLPVGDDVISQLDGGLAEKHEINVIDLHARANLVGETCPARRRILQARIRHEHGNIEIAKWARVAINLRAKYVRQPHGLLLGENNPKTPTQFGNRGDVHGMLAD